MNRNEFFKGIGTETLTPERLSELMTSAVAEMAYHCNFLSAPFWAVTDILYGRKNLLVAVWPLTLKEDASVTGCLFFVPEFDAICFLYGSFACEEIRRPGDVFTIKLDDCTGYGELIERNGRLCMEFRS